MGKILKTTKWDPEAEENDTYYTVVDKDGNTTYEGFSEAIARRELQKLKSEESMEEAEAADGNVSKSESSTSSSNSSSSADSSTTVSTSPTMASEERNAQGYVADDSDPVPESKWPLLDEGKPTNSFATNEPKKYPATDSADPVSEDTASAGESAAAIVGSGLAVAAMAANAGGIANAAGDIAAAAVAAMTSKTTEVITEYAAKFAALPLSIPTGIASKTTERFNKSEGDKNKNGEDYDPIKLSLSDFMSKLAAPVEGQSEENDKKQNEKKKNKAVENAQKKLKKASDSANKILAKSTKVIGDIMTHTLEGAAWIQEQLDKEVSRAVKNVTNELETAYKDVKEDIDTFCENEGDKIGTKLVKQYNNLLEDKAKDIIDKQNKIKTKATVKVNAAIQKVKLKLFAIIGL